MNKAKYERSESSKLITIEEAKVRYQMSRNTITKLAEEYGALRRFSPRMIRIDVSAMDEKIEKSS